MAALPILALATSSLLLFVLKLPTAEAQPPKLPSSFSASDSPWRPSENRRLVSPNGNFAAGFRPYSAVCTPPPPSTQPPNSSIFAVWVLAAADLAVVWSLGCDRPVPGTSRLVLSPTGALSLDESGRNLWPGEPRGRNGTKMTLGDDGGLVFGNWRSFEYPTDTVLPNQTFQVVKNLTSGNGRYQFVNATNLVFNGSDNYWSTEQSVALNVLNGGGLMRRAGGSSFITSDVGDANLRRVTLDRDGNLRIYSLDPRSRNWTVVWQAVQESCRIHGTCGLNAICFSNGSSAAVSCLCPPGFRPVGDGRACRRKASDLRHSKFLRLDFVSFNDVDQKDERPPLTLEACRSRCLANASCVAFTYKFDGQQSCIHLSGMLLNGFWSPATKIAMFLRVASSESDTPNFTVMTAMMDTVCPLRVSLPLPPKESQTTARNLGIIGTAFAVELIAGILSFWAFLSRYSRYRDMARAFGLEFLTAGGPKRFSYAELKTATGDFTNVIGQGGFGVVYKGELPDHRIVAVKRLKAVTGSEADFWAEVTIIARMHHLNLVRLWGFCAEKEQRMLVYEYIPNASLDKYIFPQPGEESPTPDETPEYDETAEAEAAPPPPVRPLLDWGNRYRIAVGVARAIAYLHEECLEWVLHRDIKPENILLDSDFCPKVSDFGLAKLTREDWVSRSTMVRGTRGYMAPEWVYSRDRVTAKADVYSFGMVLLEMVRGVRNNQFRRTSVQGSDEWDLPGFAYEKVYEERSVEEILDPRVAGSYDTGAHAAMVERMVKTAIWCLQRQPEARPSMGKVVKMLEGTVEIMEPGNPTIFDPQHHL